MPPKRTHGPVGIEKICAYPSSLSLDLQELARAREHDPADIRDNLLCLSRSINPLWEDAVTMAVNAALPLITEEDREQIELIIVATESSVDQGKAMSTFAQHYLGIQSNCRNYEAKHACYGGTSAVMMAAHWVATGIYGDAKALVICTDQSRMSLNEPYEYVMGAGAVAMVISNNPRVLQLKLEHNGYWTQDTFDTFRPTSRVETGNGETSLYCYLDALEGAYAHYLTKAGSTDFDAAFKKHIYHVPFGGITFQAHRTLLRQWKRLKKSEAYDHFNRTSRPGLIYNSQMGGTYSGSTFIALMGMIDSCDDLQPGEQISLFSYGSGSCGEFYSAVIGPDAKELVAQADMQGQLDARHPVSVKQYEELERARTELIDRGTYSIGTEGFDDLYQRRYAGQKRLVLKGNAEHYRDYGWG